MKKTPLSRSKPLRAKWTRFSKGSGTLKTAPGRKKRAETISSLKRKLDAVFSQHIRQKYADTDGLVKCCTCGAVKHWKQMQNGHYVSRSHNSLRFDERNTHPQCVGCNIFKSGNMDSYALALTEKYGAEILKTLAEEKQKIKQFTREELTELINRYSLAK